MLADDKIVEYVAFNSFSALTCLIIFLPPHLNLPAFAIIKYYDARDVL